MARRGVLAGLAAGVAGMSAKASERVAQAAGNGAALTMGNNNSTTNAPTEETRLVRGAGGSGTYTLAIEDRTTVDSRAVYAQAGNAVQCRGQLAGNFTTAGFATFNYGVDGSVFAAVAWASTERSAGRSWPTIGLWGWQATRRTTRPAVGAYGEGAAVGVQGVGSSVSPAAGPGQACWGNPTGGRGAG